MQQSNGQSRSNKLKVAIAGGGLVGALSACLFAKRGHEVHLFEYRGDIREMEHVPGRSINLALSVRGRCALARAGLEQAAVQDHGIPMYARMIHSVSGDCNPIPYGRKDQCIYSVGRRFLNELLLSAAEKYPNVHLHFNHKLVTADLNQGLMTFERQESKEVVIESAELVVGADGAYSTTRRQLMKQPMFNYSQTYIPHGYLELCIPPSDTGEHKMPKNFLHIWPRGQFMMIALPNQDGSWTVTLFMPFEMFATLGTPKELLNFFYKYYPDAVPLIGEQRLVKDFFANKPSPLVSIKCKPYHVGKSAVILGDAAHAMVPFYGQGMNAVRKGLIKPQNKSLLEDMTELCVQGFEDCVLLDDLLEKHNSELGGTLEDFSRIRSPDAEAICDLAMYNYIEMRDLVNRRTFMWRKKLDTFLHWLAPTLWVPLYTSVTFSRMRYSACIANRQWQDKVVLGGLVTTGACAVLGAAWAWLRWHEVLEDSYRLALDRMQTLYYW